MIHRYQDISHFRAPYKDSFLSGFGAVESLPTRIVKVGGADVVGLDVARAKALYVSAPPAIMGMAIDWGLKIAPAEKDAAGKMTIDSAMVVTPADAMAEKAKGNPNIDTVLGAIARFVPQKYYIVVPDEIDSSRTGKHLIVTTRSNLALVAKPGLGSVVFTGPEDKDFGFGASAKPGMSIASMAGYGAVGLLLITALTMASRKSRR